MIMAPLLMFLALLACAPPTSATQPPISYPLPGVLSTSLEYETNPPNPQNISHVIPGGDLNPFQPEKDVHTVSCEVARIKCALRRGCGTALQSYMLDCDEVMRGRIQHCDEFCKASLIALTSTDEGENLMRCKCSDKVCTDAKERLEVCKSAVLSANARNAVVSCGVAHLICSADTSCSTALYYYDKYCGKMFSGRECTFRCNNSISILTRQAKAGKLATCLCDGTESFACQSIKTNMAALCFKQQDDQTKQEDEEDINQIDGTVPGTQNGTKEEVSAGACLRGNVWLGHLVIFLAAGVLGISESGYLVGFTSSSVVRW